MGGRLLTGTSGYSYREWKPGFYPADLPQRLFLSYYAERLTSVEMNNTFYRMPTDKTLTSWADQTPESFTFTLKAPQRITHFARLRNADEPLAAFLRAAKSLGPRLGAILFQLPPTLRYDAGLLEEFLSQLPGGAGFRFAMEFRHASWSDPAVTEALTRHGVAWCVADTDEADATMVRTAKRFAYLRLRKIDYDDDALKRWAGEVGAALDDGADVYCYFKHEDDPSGVRFALRLRELVSG